MLRTITTPEGIVITHINHRGDLVTARTWVGVTKIFGVNHSVDIVEVYINDNDEMVPVCDPDDVFKQMQEYYDGCYKTVEIPNLIGSYVFFICPFSM